MKENNWNRDCDESKYLLLIQLPVQDAESTVSNQKDHQVMPNESEDAALPPGAKFNRENLRDGEVPSQKELSSYFE